jgi:similar to stage IV sporulation protein
MKNQWIHFYTGTVTVKCSGNGQERLLNALTRNGILIWNVKRNGTKVFTFKIRLEDAKKIRPLARKSECKIEFMERTGFPFFIKRLLKNSGFLVGGFIFIVVLFLLSNMIWNIEIKGANPATEYKIQKELDKIGVRKGRLQFLVQDPESIQRALSNNIEEITWVGVELEGTTYHFQVVEKNEPEKPAKFGPQNLIAKKKAIIVDMFVEKGQEMVNIYDHVKPGQLLVSGEIGTEKEKQIVAAKGIILGETWYKSEVILPLKSTFQVYNGNEKEKHFLKFGKVSLPIWGMGRLSFKEYEKETNATYFRFLNWKLPIAYVHDTYRESELVTRDYSIAKAQKVAKEMARKDIKKQLPDDAEIKGEKVLHHSIRNGKVYLIMLFQVHEDIAKAQPIIRGESE